LAVNSRS